MKKLPVTCASCGTVFQKDAKEYNRRLKDGGPDAPFYCSAACSNKPRESPTVVKTCKCGNVFSTNTGATYCGRACASKFSMTEDRKRAILNGGIGNRFNGSAANVAATAIGLRKREFGKYDEIHAGLLCNEESYLFEFALPGTRYIYDLALFGLGVLIEFDEEYHANNKASDALKDEAAVQRGWQIRRINVVGLSQPYPLELLRGIVPWV